MKDFYDFLDENHITPENTPCSDYILLKKAYRRGMKSQKSRISRLSRAKKELESLVDGYFSRIEKLNRLLDAIEEELEK